MGDFPRPATPDTLPLNYCEECGLTWLESKADFKAEICPNPEAYFKPEPGSKVEPISQEALSLTHVYRPSIPRSVVVFFSGISIQQQQSTVGSVGVYFGPDSPYNFSQRQGGAWSHRAIDLKAALEALRKVRQSVDAERQTLICNSMPKGDKDSWGNIKRFRLVAATDSSCVVDWLCRELKTWTLVGSTYVNTKGEPVKESRGLLVIKEELEALAKAGIQVVWYHVPREHNQNAHKLMREALQ
ncbi:hypothetical protein F4820DRAFT_436386 [Hypoxylon rubiginosum]|uniref:Uncharacterized protein n=1 Tax=Hypoxylon rubiginosum TaxID=110542 RepID=A0ACB9YME3_9PEZI|nr:hypothetical protein F4820DRAFT_436386 [Hypoxylon rubiginosum]